MNQYGQIIAIGGGGFGRNPNKPIIEEYILQLSNVNKPKICVYFFLYISFFRSDIPLDQLLLIVIMNLVLLLIPVTQIIITTQQRMIKKNVTAGCYDPLKF